MIGSPPNRVLLTCCWPLWGGAPANPGAWWMFGAYSQTKRLAAAKFTVFWR
jgi:hypothetical protein